MATTVGMKAEVVTKGNPRTLLKQTELNVKNALKAMADATVQRAQMLRSDANAPGVPYKSGALSATGISYTANNGMTSVAEFGNGLAYGRYQEFGGDGKRVVQNYTTPGTGAHYLKGAGDSVAKEGIKNYL